MAHLGYTFAGATSELSRPSMAAHDVRPRLLLVLAVPSKCVSNDDAGATETVLLEAGRAKSTRARDTEPVVNALVNKVCALEPSGSKRRATFYNSASRGKGGNSPRQLYAQARALRLQLDEGYEANTPPAA